LFPFGGFVFLGPWSVVESFIRNGAFGIFIFGEYAFGTKRNDLFGCHLVKVFVYIAISRGNTSIGTVSLWIFEGKTLVLLMHSKIGIFMLIQIGKIGFDTTQHGVAILFHPFRFVVFFVGLTMQFAIDHVCDPVYIAWFQCVFPSCRKVQSIASVSKSRVTKSVSRSIEGGQGSIA